MKRYIKIKSEKNDNFIKVRTYYSKEHKSLILSINHVIITSLESNPYVQMESFTPSQGLCVKLMEMKRDNKKLVENHQPDPETLKKYIDIICSNNNLILNDTI